MDRCSLFLLLYDLRLRSFIFCIFVKFSERHTYAQGKRLKTTAKQTFAYCWHYEICHFCVVVNII